MNAVPADSRALLRILQISRPSRGKLILGVVAGALTIGCGTGLFAASGFLIARASEHPGEAALALAVVAVRAFGLGRGCFRYVERLATHDAALTALSELRVVTWVRLTRVAPAGLGRRHSGDALSRFVTDIESVQDLLVRGLTPPLVAGLTVACTVAGIAIISLSAAAVLAAGLLVVGVLLPMVSVHLSAATADAAAHDRGVLARLTTDLVDGAADLAAFGAGRAALERIAATDARLLSYARRWSWAAAIGNGVGIGVAGATVWTLVVTAVIGASRGQLTRVDTAVIILVGLAAFEAVTPLAAAAQQLTAVRAGARRTVELLDAPDALSVARAPHPMPAGPAHLQLIGARLSYGNGTAPALDGVDLDLVPGRRVALIGPAGAGKSSVAAVLLRLRDLDGGVALLNGLPLGDLDPDALRTVVGGCLADAYLFDSTLRENLLLARPGATQSELDAVAERVHLLAWIREQRLGWDTAVGAHGAALSGGERQRLTLARALLADPEVLILDEPTAHLDPAHRDAVMADLIAATVGRTVLLITHDTVGLEAMDEILSLDTGRIVDARRPALDHETDGPMPALAREWCGESGGPFDPGGGVGQRDIVPA